MVEPDPAARRRGARDALARVLSRHPVALLEGPAGIGKSCVARAVAAEESMAYLSLADDDATRTALIADPAAWLASLPGRVVIDDCHLVPALLAQLELLAERRSQPGLVLAVQRPVPSRVALRHVECVSLSSLTRGELRNRIGRFINAAFAAAEPTGWALEPLSVQDCMEIALVGGLPALAGVEDRTLRAKLYREIVDARLDDCGSRAASLRATLDMVLTRPSCRITFERDAAVLGVTVERLHQDLVVLSDLGLVLQTPAWTRFRRSADSVRAYSGDPGFLSWRPVDITGADQGRAGPAPEVVMRTIAAHELAAQNAWARHPVEMSFWRSKPVQYEIDFLLEDHRGSVIPVTVSPSIAPGSTDFAGIDAFRRRHPRAYVRGLVLYPGDRIRGIGYDRWAVPLSTLWSVADGDAPLDVGSFDTELEAAVGALRVMVGRSGRSSAEVVRRREEIELSMSLSLAPRLERIGLVLDSVGLGIEKLDCAVLPAPEDDDVPAWASGAVGAGLVEHLGAEASVVVASAMGVRPARSPGGAATLANWFVFVGAAVNSTTTTWGAGHLVRCVDGTVRLVGESEMVAGESPDELDGLIDQLCAAVATTLPDAMAALAA